MGNFNPQNLANTAWAFATVGQPDVQLFMVLARAAEWSMGEFKAQCLANTAWAFAVVNYYSDRLFGPAFAHRCEIWADAEVQHRFLRQLHQWVLWHRERELPPPLSPALCKLCIAATKFFQSQSSSPSYL